MFGLTYFELVEIVFVTLLIIGWSIGMGKIIVDLVRWYKKDKEEFRR